MSGEIQWQSWLLIMAAPAIMIDIACYGIGHWSPCVRNSKQSQPTSPALSYDPEGLKCEAALGEIMYRRQSWTAPMLRFLP